MVLASKFDYSATILETHPLSWVFLVLDLHNILLLLLEFKLFYLYLYWLCWPVNCGVFRFHMLTYTWGLQRRVNIRLKKLSHRGIIVETWLGDEGVTLILTFSVLVESLTFMYKQVFLISSFIKIASKVSFIPKYSTCQLCRRNTSFLCERGCLYTCVLVQLPLWHEGRKPAMFWPEPAAVIQLFGLEKWGAGSQGPVRGWGVRLGTLPRAGLGHPGGVVQGSVCVLDWSLD